MQTTAGQKRWYIIHTYSGFERKVAESLRSRVAAFGLEDHIGEIKIPTEPIIEMKGGKKVTSDRMFYPGYVLVEMEMDEHTWHVVPAQLLHPSARRKLTKSFTGWKFPPKNPGPSSALSTASR